MFEVGIFDDKVGREHAGGIVSATSERQMMLSAELDSGNEPRGDLAAVGAVADKCIYETLSLRGNLNLDCAAVTCARCQPILVTVCPLGRQYDVLRHG
jgi:hypothetical protein